MLRETPVKEIARGRWKEILPHFGIGADHLTGNHTSCPICGGTDRFRFDDRHGEGMFFCNQCGAGDGFGLLLKAKGIKFIDIAEYVRKTYNSLPEIRKNYHANDKRVEARLQRAIKTAWEASWRPTPTSPSTLWLTARLGRPWASNAIRENNEGMISLLQSPDGSIGNVHITRLNRDGTKREDGDIPAKRFMKGPLPDGAAIRIWDAKPVMGIAEGIETAMAAAVMFKMPVWAATNATLLAKWTPPEIAKEIHIFADNDANFTGQSRAFALANRLKIRSEVSVIVHIPEKIDSDWNDILKDKLA